MVITYSIFDTNIGALNVSHIGNSYIFNYPCSSYQSCTYYSVTLPPGDYKIELWGAQGGDCSNSTGGQGGYSYGYLSVSESFSFSLYLGGKGVCLSSTYSPGGYNGGGQSGRETNCWGASGGGSSDIRVLGNSDYHRILVAGGGGGSGYGNPSANSCYHGFTNGGHGGGSSGQSGTESCSYTTSGGTQENAGVTSRSYNKQPASFGLGGSVIDASQMYAAGGGGGGWYGGAAGDAFGNSGSGGSGYILLPTSHIPIGYLISDKTIFSNGATMNGNQSTTLTNGQAIVTLLSNINENTIIYSYKNCFLQEFPGSQIVALLFIIIFSI